MEFDEAKPEIHIPPDYAALSAVGAGHIGEYDHCVSIILFISVLY